MVVKSKRGAPWHAPRRLHKLVTEAKAQKGYAQVVNNYEGRRGSQTRAKAKRQQLPLLDAATCLLQKDLNEWHLIISSRKQIAQGANNQLLPSIRHWHIFLFRPFSYYIVCDASPHYAVSQLNHHPHLTGQRHKIFSLLACAQGCSTPKLFAIHGIKAAHKHIKSSIRK